MLCYLWNITETKKRKRDWYFMLLSFWKGRSTPIWGKITDHNQRTLQMLVQPGKWPCQSRSSAVFHICHKIQVQTQVLLPWWLQCQHTLPNELEVFSYALAHRSSAKLQIQICISKYDDDSRQSPNAVRVWQCPLHQYLGGRKEQKRYFFTLEDSSCSVKSQLLL